MTDEHDEKAREIAEFYHMADSDIVFDIATALRAAAAEGAGAERALSDAKSGQIYLLQALLTDIWLYHDEGKWPREGSISEAISKTLTGLTAAEGAGEWLPIEKAEKTSKARLVWCPAWRNTYIVSWVVPLDDKAQPDPAKGFWSHFGGSSPLRERPTHWQPLPEPPTTDQQREG